MKAFFRALICLFRRDCPVFRGDDYTDWVRQQGQESREGRRLLKQVRETGNPIADVLDPPRPTRRTP